MVDRRSKDNGAKKRSDDGDSGMIADLESALRIDENDLEQSVHEQPEAFYRVAKSTAIAVSRRDAAKEAIKEIEATTGLKIRESIDPDEKKTEKAIDSEVRTDPKVIAAYRQFNELSTEAALVTALKESFMQRSYALKDLVAMRLAEQVQSGAADRDGRAENVRRQMSDERSRRDDDRSSSRRDHGSRNRDRA